MNLTGTNNEEFNDNIPIIATRNGKGEPIMHLDVPQGDIKELPDLKYYLDKLNLITRFPATYMDFSQAMGTTAASMIRSDLRYAKLCNSIRTLIEKTINEFISRTQSLENYNVVFSLIQLPTSEDDDVLQAMSNYTDVVGEIESLVMGDDPEEGVEQKIHRLKSLLGLVNASIKSPTIQDWYNDFLDYLEELRQKQAATKAADCPASANPISQVRMSAATKAAVHPKSKGLNRKRNNFEITFVVVVITTNPRKGGLRIKGGYGGCPPCRPWFGFQTDNNT